MTCKYFVALLATIAISGWGCSPHYLTKPESIGQKLVNPKPGRTATATDQATTGRQATITPANGEKQLGRCINDPASCIKGLPAVPQIIPIAEGSDIVLIKSGQPGYEDFAIGVVVGNVVIALPVFDPYWGFFPATEPLIIIGGIHGGPPFWPNATATDGKDHFVLLNSRK